MTPLGSSQLLLLTSGDSSAVRGLGALQVIHEWEDQYNKTLWTDMYGGTSAEVDGVRYKQGYFDGTLTAIAGSASVDDAFIFAGETDEDSDDGTAVDGIHVMRFVDPRGS